MKIVKEHFVLNNGKDPNLVHVELDSMLPEITQFHDVLDLNGSKYKIVGLRSPASNRVTLQKL